MVMQHYVEQQILSGTNGFDRVESVKDDERSGWPTTSRSDDNIATVDKMLKEDRKVTSRLMADTLGIPKTVVLWILREDSKK